MVSPHVASIRKNVALVTAFQKCYFLCHRLILTPQTVTPVHILLQVLVMILSLTKDFGPQDWLVGLK